MHGVLAFLRTLVLGSSSILWLSVGTLLFTSSCSDKDKGSGFVGIGTVELNDSVFAIHYYKSVLNVADRGWVSSLTDSARVYFSGTAYGPTMSDEQYIYDFHPNSISADLTTPLVSLQNADSVVAASGVYASAEGFYAQNVHITRDWRRNDYFDASVTYPGGGDGVNDVVALIRDSAAVEEDSLNVFWLRLHREVKDTLQIITRHVSVPVNCLRDSTKERIYIRLKRINAYNDTVVTDMTYSYVNWIE